MTPDVLALLQGLTEQQKLCIICSSVKRNRYGLPILVRPWHAHYFYLNKPFINIIYWLTYLVA